MDDWVGSDAICCCVVVLFCGVAGVGSGVVVGVCSGVGAGVVVVIVSEVGVGVVSTEVVVAEGIPAVVVWIERYYFCKSSRTTI